MRSLAREPEQVKEQARQAILVALRKIATSLDMIEMGINNASEALMRLSEATDIIARDEGVSCRRS